MPNGLGLFFRFYKGLPSEDHTTTEKTKLSNISNAASFNSSDAVLLNRSNHTGSQPSSTISDFTSSVNTLISRGITGKENTIADGTTIALSGASVSILVTPRS